MNSPAARSIQKGSACTSHLAIIFTWKVPQNQLAKESHHSHGSETLLFPRKTTKTVAFCFVPNDKRRDFSRDKNSWNPIAGLLAVKKTGKRIVLLWQIILPRNHLRLLAVQRPQRPGFRDKKRIKFTWNMQTVWRFATFFGLSNL